MPGKIPVFMELKFSVCGGKQMRNKCINIQISAQVSDIKRNKAGYLNQVQVMRGAMLARMVRGGFSKEIEFEQRNKGSEAVSHMGYSVV